MTAVPMIETDGRSVPEWIGKSPDSVPPPRVRLRIFNRYGGRCYLSKRLIRPGDKWDAEHIIALTLGGENREKNLAPALKAPHKVKTGQDRKIKKRTDARRKKHIGIHKPRTITRWRKFNGEIVIAGRER
jgi:5-methylcytosine-specific restriction protein A